ncbi:pyridoxamine 5'-phosphate oxidase family protein [Megasphaera elsdenii]|uniref:pyridoxamine 5'-phosphate oxidase family protein n=1 Tax=Megasphaera elsdenii TaxID=907 RepID=UPI0039F4553A
MLTNVFFDCIKHDGIVSVASANAEGQAHIANTWNKYLIVTDDEKILIPCFGFHKTEKNVSHNPRVEVVVGSHEVQGKMGMGTGCLLTGTAAFASEGPLFDEMKEKCTWASRVLIFTPQTCVQTI